MMNESWKTWFFRHGLNWYPMYSGTGGRIEFLAGNWQRVVIRLKLGLRTRNYVGTIFGGSQFAALDPFHMVLLMNSLGRDYVVWDKAGAIRFKRPGKKRMTATIEYSDDELSLIRAEVLKTGKHEFVKSVDWVDVDGVVISTFEKTVYVATQEFHKQRLAAAASKK